jgi:hypothetical protein
MIRANPPDLLPLTAKRVTAGESAHVYSARRRHQLRYPVARQIERLEPFDTEDPSTLRPGKCGELPQSALQGQHQVVRFAGSVQGSAHCPDVAPDSVEVTGDERNDPRSGFERLGQAEYDAIGYGADLAESLSDDEVRPEQPHLVGVDRYDGAACFSEVPYLCIDGSAG